MELYEIIKRIRKPTKNEEYFNPEVITATMDKITAQQMLEIYRQNQDDNEIYDLRTIKAIKPIPSDPIQINYEHCRSCNSFNLCVDAVLNRPNEMNRCVRFGGLKYYFKERRG